MRSIKTCLLAFVVVFQIVCTTGCWNYREIDTVAIVAGVAVDKGTEDKYMITAEIVQISGGRDSKTSSKIVSMEGRSIFDAVRNKIALQGKRLYWAHSKLIIISEEIAREGMTKVIDWYIRDSETRADAYVLVSTGNTAKEVLEGETSSIEEVKSFELDRMLENQKSLSKAPVINAWEFSNRLSVDGFSAIAPAVHLKESDGEMIPQIMGTAVFKGDKLIGLLDGHETKEMLFVQNQIKGGVFANESKTDDTYATLEIFKSKTKIQPVNNGELAEMRVIIDITTAIDEIDGTTDLMDDKERETLEQTVEEILEKHIQRVIRKVQTEYGADIFGFGAKLREKRPEMWRRVEGNWEEVFRALKVSVEVKVTIRNSAMLSEPLKVGD